MTKTKTIQFHLTDEEKETISAAKEIVRKIAILSQDYKSGATIATAELILGKIYYEEIFE